MEGRKPGGDMTFANVLESGVIDWRRLTDQRCRMGTFSGLTTMIYLEPKHVQQKCFIEIETRHKVGVALCEAALNIHLLLMIYTFSQKPYLLFQCCMTHCVTILGSSHVLLNS